jgi:hypothetical protein
MSDIGNEIKNPILPITLYDALLQKVVGVFKTKNICGKYIYGDLHNCNLSKNISTYIKRKTRFKIGDLKYAVRTANEEQKAILGDLDFVILNGYNQPKKNTMR